MNELEKIARIDDRAAAIQYTCKLLKLTPALAEDNIPDHWSDLSTITRLSALGSWIRAEAFELMDRL